MPPKPSGISIQSRFVRPTQAAVAPLFSRISENISSAWKEKTNGYGESSPTQRRRLSTTVPGMTRNSPIWKRRIPVSSATSNPKLLQQTTAHFQHLRPCSQPTVNHRRQSVAASLAERRGIRAPAVPHPCELTKPSNIPFRNVPSAARRTWGNRVESTTGLSRTYPPSNPQRRNTSTMNTTALLVTPRWRLR